MRERVHDVRSGLSVVFVREGIIGRITKEKAADQETGLWSVHQLPKRGGRGRAWHASGRSAEYAKSRSLVLPFPLMVPKRTLAECQRLIGVSDFRKVNESDP